MTIFFSFIFASRHFLSAPLIKSQPVLRRAVAKAESAPSTLNFWLTPREGVAARTRLIIVQDACLKQDLEPRAAVSTADN